MTPPLWLVRRAGLVALVTRQRQEIRALRSQLRGLASAHDQEKRSVLHPRVIAAQAEAAEANAIAERCCLEAENRRTEQARLARDVAALRQERDALVKQLGVTVRERDELRGARHG